jgi:hypothetical protein
VQSSVSDWFQRLPSWTQERRRGNRPSIDYCTTFDFGSAQICNGIQRTRFPTYKAFSTRRRHCELQCQFLVLSHQPANFLDGHRCCRPCNGRRFPSRVPRVFLCRSKRHISAQISAIGGIHFLPYSAWLVRGLSAYL